MEIKEGVAVAHVTHEELVSLVASYILEKTGRTVVGGTLVIVEEHQVSWGSMTKPPSEYMTYSATMQLEGRTIPEAPVVWPSGVGFAEQADKFCASVDDLLGRRK